jgi:prepilin-type N-terminal cleavage/methylation domain-containing protein
MRFKSSRGFSVTELLIVIAVGGLILSFAVPAMQESVGASRLQSSAVQLSSELNFARTIAISRNAIFELRINPGQRTFQIVDPADPENPPRTAKLLDQGVVFGQGGPANIRFFPRGHAGAAVITLFNQLGQRIDIQVRTSGMINVNDFQAAAEND